VKIQTAGHVVSKGSYGNDLFSGLFCRHATLMRYLHRARGSKQSKFLGHFRIFFSHRSGTPSNRQGNRSSALPRFSMKFKWFEWISPTTLLHPLLVSTLLPMTVIRGDRHPRAATHGATGEAPKNAKGYLSQTSSEHDRVSWAARFHKIPQ